MKLILRNNPPPKPPEWWLAAKEREGRKREASYAIWFKNYTPGRKDQIWDMASDEDFRLAGYLENDPRRPPT